MPRLVAKEVLSIFSENGVPPAVLFSNYAQDYEETLASMNVEIQGKPLSLSTKKQREYIPKLFVRKIPYLAVLGGENHDAVAAQVALEVCLNAVGGNVARPFYWHVLTGSTSDAIRDNPVNYDAVKDTKLLVISGVAANSTAMKVEKLRDLLTMFSAVPRLVVVAGINPLEYCYHTLYVKPNYLLNFGTREQNNG